MVVRAIEEIDRFASKVMLNNHLDSEYKQEQASMLYVNLQTASDKLHAATNIFVDGRFRFHDENFRFHINYFVMVTEDRGEEIYD